MGLRYAAHRAASRSRGQGIRRSRRLTSVRPATFWTYLIAALQTEVRGVGASALPLLQSDAPIEPVLTLLINELGALPHDGALVLGDLHVVESPDIEEGFSAFARRPAGSGSRRTRR